MSENWKLLAAFSAMFSATAYLMIVAQIALATGRGLSWKLAAIALGANYLCYILQLYDLRKVAGPLAIGSLLIGVAAGLALLQ